VVCTAHHGQVHVERLGEQLAGLGQEGQPGLPAQVGAAEAVVLQVQREALGDDGGQRLGVPGGRGVQFQLAGVRPVHRQRHPDGVGVLARLPAVPRQQLPPGTVAAVEPHHPAGRAGQAGQPGQQVGREVGERLVGLPSRVDLQQRGQRADARGARRQPVSRRHQRGGRLHRDVALQAEPHALAGALVHRAPARGEVVDQQQAAAALGDLADVHALVAGADRELLDGAGREVGDRHGQPGPVGADLDVQLGVGVHHRVRRELGGQQQRLVEQRVEPRVLEHRADERACRRRGTPVVGQPDPPDEPVRRDIRSRHACILSCRWGDVQSRLSH